jgi:hypothetical protein
LLERTEFAVASEDIVPRFSEWISNPIPGDAGLDTLLRWCCNVSDSFQDEFLINFAELFAADFERTELRQALALLFVQTLAGHGTIEQVEAFLEDIKRVFLPCARSAKNREKIAAVCGALGDLEVETYRPLEPMILRILGDEEATRAEIEFAEGALVKMGAKDTLRLFEEVISEVPMRLQNGEMCSDVLVRQVQLFFHGCSQLARGFRERLRLSDDEMERVFPEELLAQMRPTVVSDGSSSEEFDLSLFK